VAQWEQVFYLGTKISVSVLWTDDVAVGYRCALSWGIRRRWVHTSSGSSEL